MKENTNTDHKNSQGKLKKVMDLGDINIRILDSLTGPHHINSKIFEYMTKLLKPYTPNDQ